VQCFGFVFWIPLKNAYLDPPTGRIDSLALDCRVGSPLLSVGKRDKITLEWCSVIFRGRLLKSPFRFGVECAALRCPLVSCPWGAIAADRLKLSVEC